MVIAKLKEPKTSTKPRDSVNAYLKEIGRVPLLDGEQEIILAKQVQSMMSCLATKEELEKQTGIILEHLPWAKALDISEEELKQILRQGQWAKNKLIRANLRLVVSVAKKYLNRGLDLLDLIQEGTLGLQRATEKFDPGKGYKFSTYAFWWIRQAIIRAISNQARTIRLPIHVTEKINKIKKAQRELALKLGRTATTTEVAAELDIASDEVREYIKKSRNTLSLNVKVGKEQDSELFQLIEDKSPSSETQLAQSLLKEEIYKILSELKPKEREVIALRFGLIDGEEWTLGAIGKKLNVSRERARQIQSKALLRLKRQDIGALRDYVVG